MNWIEHVLEPQRLILAWRAPDHIGIRYRWEVSELTPIPEGDVSLRYFAGEEFERLNQSKPVIELKRLGYRGYPGFLTRDLVHAGVLDAFRRRLPPPSRSDFSEYQSTFGFERT